MTKSKEPLYCSFCNKSHEMVKKLIAGPNCYICDECIELCYDIIKQEEITEVKDNETIPTPMEICKFLNEYVIGQDYAKMVVSVAVNNHYKRLQNPIIDDVEIDKSNILFMGPTGSGKTLIAKTIARMLDVPFYIADATSLTEAGYVGDDVETIITGLLQNADFDIEKAQHGIIYIDEIDKKGSKSDSASITRDVSGEGVQQALLKIIEGAVVRVPPNGGRKHPQQEMAEIDTKNILFIVGGAFVGLTDIVNERLHKNTSGIGFGAKLDTNSDEMKDILEHIEPEDLIRFGLIPELIGRLPIISGLEELTEEQLVEILTTPKNAISKQFQKMFMLENVELEFTDDAYTAVANIAKEKKTGARGLRNVIENKLIPLQFELPELSKDGLNKVVIDGEVISGDKEPIKIFEKKTKTKKAVDK